MIARGLALLLAVTLAGCASSNPRPPGEQPHAPDFLLYRDDHGNMAGCSWYCGAPPVKVSATSTLRDGIFSYSPDNAHDTKKDTVWVEGAEGVGIGERLIFTFDMTDREPESDPDYDFGISSVSIINGFARSEQLWRANGRVKRLKIIFDGKLVGEILLSDTREPKSYDLPRIVLRPKKIHEVAFEIAEIYPGERYEDTALADFFFSGFGVH